MSQTENAADSSPQALAPRLAAIIHGEGFANAERARLKRMSVTGPAPLAFHRFVLRHIPPAWQAGRWELPWRTLICGLARQHENPHAPSTPFGRALAECAYSELRLESLLAADGRVLATLTLRATMLLAAKRQHCNWRDIAGLLFAFSDDVREGINQRIARDFYRTASTENTADISA